MANFTPQEIEEMLQEFFDTVGKRQYVGARYVPIFGRKGEDTITWNNLAPYEPLTVVMHNGVSYVSKQYVPAGIDITDTAFWAETYRFNAQVEQYRQEVLQFQSQIDQIREDMESDFVPFPDSDAYPKYGTTGQVLTTLSNGGTKWEDPVVVDAAIAEPLINDWLDEHPEATTTVLDNSITDAKLVQQNGILSTVGKFTYRQNAAARVMNVPLSVSNGDVLYFKPLVWTGASFTSINVSGVISEGQYQQLVSVTTLNQEKFVTVSGNYSSLIVNVGVSDIPSSPVELQFILCNANDLDNIASYVLSNRNLVQNAQAQLDASFKYHGYVVANGNINELTDNGWYLVSSDRISGITGLPSDMNVNASLQIYKGALTVQILKELNSPYDEYQRYLYSNNTQQSTWIKKPYPDNIFSNHGYVPSGGNINNLTANGWYIISQDIITTMTGLPSNLKHNAVLRVYSGAVTLQVIREINFPYDEYQRYLYNNNTQQSTWVWTPNYSRPKTVYLFGDSLTKGILGNGQIGMGYLEQYFLKNGYTVVNCGIGGIGYVYSAAKSESEVPWNTGGGRIRAQDAINHYIPEMQSNAPDTIILAYGVNDWQTLGDSSVTITESDRRATSANIEANVKAAISSLMTAVPYTRIIVCTPINTSYRGGSVASGYALQTALTNNNDGLEAMTLEKVYNAIVAACEYYGVKYVDMTHNNSVVNFLNINTALPDKLHPAQGTYYRLADDFGSRFK